MACQPPENSDNSVPSERFHYRPEIRQELEKARKLRFRFWLVFLFPFVALGIPAWFSEDGWVAAIVVIGVIVIVWVVEKMMRQFGHQTIQLLGQHLEYTGTELRQVGADGKVLGRINLRKQFWVTYPGVVSGNAIYQVYQEYEGRTHRVEFSSMIEGGEQIAREILQESAWPPGSDS